VSDAPHLVEYRAAYRRRQAERNARLEQRRALGLASAASAARLLRDRFRATRVVVFGSLAGGVIDERSDVDLAAWGIAEGDFLGALALVLALDSQFSFDLVRAEEAPPSLLEAIERGTDL
jgi:predicted nucleotidyltransferase